MSAHGTGGFNSRVNVMFGVAGFRPGSRATFVSAKVAKTIDAPSGFIRGEGRKLAEGGLTRRAQTKPAGSGERPTQGPDGRRQGTATGT